MSDSSAQPLQSQPRGLDEGALRESLLEPSGAYARIDVVEGSASTNDDALTAMRRQPSAWPDLSVIAADNQTNAHGRLGRQWVSTPGASLALSIVLRPHTKAGQPLPTRSYSWLTLIAALALCNAVREIHSGADATIKWPNDVLVNDKKLAGVLAQLDMPADGTPPAVVLGIGINVAHTAEQLPVPTATSLALEGAVEATTSSVAIDFLSEFASLYRRFCDHDGEPAASGLDREILSRLDTIGRRVRAELPDGSQLLGTATAIDDDGALQLTDAAGQTHVVHAGDVVHLRTQEGADGAL